MQTVEESSAVWLEKRRNFHVLAKSMQELVKTLERQAGCLFIVSFVIRGVCEAPLRPWLRPSSASGAEYTLVTCQVAATDGLSQKCKRVVCMSW